MRLRIICHLFRCACHNHPPSGIPAIRTEVDDPVSRLDNVHVVLDHKHCIPFIDQPLEGGQKFFYIIKMESGRGFVKNEKPLSAVTGFQISGKLETLGLSPGKGVYGLAKAHVTKAHIGEWLKGIRHFALVFKKGKSPIHRHGKDIVYVVTLVHDFQHLFLKALPSAVGARDKDIGEKLHLHLFKPFSPACFAPAPGHIKGKMARSKTPFVGIRGIGQEMADGVCDLSVR